MLHTPIRYFVCGCHLSFYAATSYLSMQRSSVAFIAMLINGTEITALLLLTVVSSSTNFELHKVSFLVFLLCSVIYMILTINTWKHICKRLTASLKLKRSLYCKRIFAGLNWLCLLGAGYFYKRHNERCEPGVYSMFALCEYLVVLTNIAFHGTAVLDFSALSSQMMTVKATYLDV